MDIDITGRHVHVTDALKNYATQKVRKFDKYALQIESAHVVMAVEKIRQIVEITASGKNLRVTAKAQSSDMYAAFDDCFAKLQLQLARRHDRVKDHKSRQISRQARGEKAAS